MEVVEAVGGFVENLSDIHDDIKYKEIIQEKIDAKLVKYLLRFFCLSVDIIKQKLAKFL